MQTLDVGVWTCQEEFTRSALQSRLNPVHNQTLWMVHCAFLPECIYLHVKVITVDPQDSTKFGWGNFGSFVLACNGMPGSVSPTWVGGKVNHTARGGPGFSTLRPGGVYLVSPVYSKYEQSIR